MYARRFVFGASLSCVSSLTLPATSLRKSAWFFRSDQLADRPAGLVVVRADVRQALRLRRVVILRQQLDLAGHLVEKICLVLQIGPACRPPGRPGSCPCRCTPGASSSARRYPASAA